MYIGEIAQIETCLFHVKYFVFYKPCEVCKTVERHSNAYRAWIIFFNMSYESTYVTQIMINWVIEALQIIVYFHRPNKSINSPQATK